MLYLSRCCVMLYEQIGEIIDIHMPKDSFERNANMLDKIHDCSVLSLL